MAKHRQKFEDLTISQQFKRRILSEEGIACWECGCSLIGLEHHNEGICDECLREEIRDAERN